VRTALEDDAPGKQLHLPELLSQLAVISYGLFHFGKLFCRQSHRHGLLGDFASPLIASTSASPRGAILDRALADVAKLTEVL
jgi:hypothetical protein